MDNPGPGHCIERAATISTEDREDEEARAQVTEGEPPTPPCRIQREGESGAEAKQAPVTSPTLPQPAPSRAHLPATPRHQVALVFGVHTVAEEGGGRGVCSGSRWEGGKSLSLLLALRSYFL